MIAAFTSRRRGSTALHVSVGDSYPSHIYNEEIPSNSAFNRIENAGGFILRLESLCRAEPPTLLPRHMTSEPSKQLATIEHLAKLSESDFLASIVATATISNNGCLGDVKGIDNKVRALFELSAWDKLSVCCVASELMDELIATKPDINNFTNPRLISATNFGMLVEELYTEAMSRPGVRRLQQLSRSKFSTGFCAQSTTDMPPVGITSQPSSIAEVVCSATKHPSAGMGRQAFIETPSSDSDTEKPASYLRRRIRIVPNPSPKLKDLLKQISNVRSNTIGLENIKREIVKADIDDFGRCIAKAITTELLGDTREMLSILNGGKFTGINEQVRLLYRGIAYEKLWELDDRNLDRAIADYAFVLSKPCWEHCNASEDYRQLVLAASFNINICFEKKGLFEHVDFGSFLNYAEGDIRIIYGDKLWHKAYVMQMITHMRSKTPPIREEWKKIKQALDEQRSSDPAGYVKTLLTWNQRTGTTLKEDDIAWLFNSGQLELPVHATASILAELVRQLLKAKGENHLLLKIIARLEKLVSENPDPTVAQYLEAVRKWLNKANASK